MLVLYLLGGCIVGLFFLLRSRAVIWKKPLLWASSIAFLNFLTNICEVPLNWMGYDTALSAREFLVQQLLVAAGEFLLWVLLLTITFIAAEGLTRRAFPQMIQHWKLWSPRIASSKDRLCENSIVLSEKDPKSRPGSRKCNTRQM